MGKALKTAGAIIGGAVLMATGVGALAGLQVTAMGIAGIGTMSVANLQLMSAGLMAAGSMLDKPKSTASGSPSDWTSNPDQGTPFLFGRMGVAGKIVHRDEYGQDNRLQGIVSVYSGAGPVKSFQGFTADELPVSFVSNGGTAVGKYNRQMWRSWRMGAQPDTALSLPTGLDGGAVMPMWGPLYKLSGKACDLLTLQQDSKFSVYPSGEPKPMQVLEGVYGYDPRYDDTYPGGAGPCRYGVRSTYRYIDNAIIAALNWALGMVENGQVVGGIGASLQGVDLPAFVESANIADANAWTVAAWPDTSEDASVVLDELLEAGGAKRSRVAGKISCVSRGAPRPSIVTITRRDTAGAIELDTGASRFNRLNTITPVIMSEAHKWQHAPMNPVSFAPLVAEDGGKRSDQIKYRFVSQVKQGAELAAYDILDAREPFAGTIPLLPHLRRLKPGDCFDIDEPGFMLDGVKMLVLGRSYDPKAGEVRIAFRSETDSKHPLALGKTTSMPDYPGLTAPDPTEVSPPLPGDWTITPRPPAPGGGQLPGFDLGGIVSNATATAVIVEYGPTLTGPWTQAYQGPPTVTNIPIDGVQPGATYYIAVQYRRNQNYSERYVYGPYEAPDLIAGGLAPESPIWGQLNDLTKQALRTAIEAAQALLDEEQRRQIEVEDILDRLGLGFLLDPVTRTALIKSETVVEGVGPGGLPETLVQMSARLVAADAANELNTAQALITAEARINSLRSESYAAFATYNAMGDAIAANALVIRGQVTAEIVTATANLVSTAQMGTAISNSEVSLRNWTNGRISESVTGLASTAYVAGSLATAKGQWEAYADDAAARSIVGLDSVAAREAALGAAVLSLQSWSDGRFASGAALLAVQSTANNASSTAALALSAANGNEAYAALTADSGGRLTSMRIDGVTRAIDFLGETFNVTAEGGNGISYSAASKVFKIFGEGQKTLMKASGGVRFWSGPTTVPDGSETAENGVIALGPGVPGGGQFNGLTLSRPFDTGVGSDTAIVIQPDTWTVIAETSLHYMREGVFMTAASIEALVSSSTADGSVSWVVESVNAAGGDPVIVAQGGFLLPANIIPWTTGRSAYLPGLGRRTGERRLRLSIAWSNPPVTGVTTRKARLWGLYAAELTSWPN